MVRPRYSEVDNEALELLNKAQKLLKKTEELQKAAKCPHCDGDAARSKCICGKVEKEDKCPSCGMKKSECLNKMGCGMKKYGEMKKASPNFITTFSTEPQDVTFVAESGGQTRNAYYTSNQHLLDSEDVANKGATSYAYNLDTLSPTVNTHDRPLESHEITSGGESKTNE